MASLAKRLITPVLRGQNVAFKRFHHCESTGLRALGPKNQLPQFKSNAVVNGEFRVVSSKDYEGKWLIFFFYPLDFTFVCPTEIIAFNDRVEEFRKLDAEVVACSCDSHFSHLAWVNTPRKEGGLGDMTIPIVSDFSKSIARSFGVLEEASGLSYRGLFLSDPKGVIRHCVVNDLPIGRSVDETLRVLKALQHFEKHGEVCPADWEEDQPTIKPNKVKNDQSYVTVSRSTESPQGPLGSDMIEKRPTYQNSSPGLRQLTIQEVHLSYKCSSTETASTKKTLPHAGPLYVDYSTIDESPEKTAMETIPYRPHHYASEPSLLEAQRYSRVVADDYESEQQLLQQHKRPRRTPEPPQRRTSRGKPKHLEKFEESFAIRQEESRNPQSRRFAETLVKSMSYSRRPSSPKRHSTTFEAEPYREDGIRLYARYDDQVHDTRGGDSTVFAPRKRQRVELEEERYRTISSGPPMISQGWRVPNLPKDIPRQQRIYREAELVKSERIIAKTAQKKPVVLPLDPVKREQFESHQRYSAPARIVQENSSRKEIDFETYKKEVQRLKEVQERQQKQQEITVFDERLELIHSPPPLPPPIHLREDIHQQRIEHIETISHDPARPMHTVTTEFPVHEPRYAIPVAPVRSPSPPQRAQSQIEEEAMRKFGEKIDILRNSKRFQHLQDPSEHLYFPRPQRTIEQIETIEIETEEYRRIPRPKTSPPPPPPPVVEPVDIPPPRSASPKPVDVSSTTSVDEHKRHIRVEVTEEILTERIQRVTNKTVDVQSEEKEVQVSQVLPEVIETATETIFLPSVDSSTQFESFSHTIDSCTQHEAPRVIDSSTGIDESELISSTEVIMTERWTQMERQTFTDVSTQETAPVAVVTDSSTQAEIVVEPLPLIETVEVATDPEPIVEPVVEIKETIETGVNTDHHPVIEKGTSEESEAQFDEFVETVTTITTEEMASAEKTRKSTSSYRSLESNYTTDRRSTTTSAELKIASPPPNMESQYKSSISSRISHNHTGRTSSPHVSGTSRILKIVSETNSIGSGVSPFGGSIAASSIRDAREREKKEMSDLNDRLASYIEKVRFLEAQNRKLGADLDFLRGRWGKDTFNIREMYETEIREARKLIDDSNVERDRLANEIKKIQDELNSYRTRYDQAHRDHINDKGVIDELLVKLAAIESELTLLKRRIGNLEDDVNAVKRENHRLLGELQRARADVDQETLNRIDYQNQVQTLLEELDFVRRAHASEILDLQAMASRDTTSENREYFKNELSAAIREIRAEYDQVCNVQRTDMESWYKLKVQEIQTQSVRMNLEQGYTKEEMKRLRTQLGDLRGKLADLEGRNSLLEKQIEELHYQIEDDQRSYESALSDRDSQIHKIRDECQALMVELQMLLDTKQTLDAEIAIYRKMLEGEEDRAGLRQLVEQVVRTQQYRESQHIETQRVLRGETSSRHSYQRSAKGNVSVQEASADGTFIVLSNTHRSKQEPIGEWKVKRSIDHKHEVVFTFPRSFVLKPGASVKIWARGHGTNNPPNSLVLDHESSWGVGNNVQTILYNTQGEERATLIQRVSHVVEH
ncbi:hypothetical protein FO519_007355 [Halicephalobus sp. NKZ332]|nr:hypothetical protein FO519_007355 [Halicephalobus sp. NKZ332]